MPDSRLGSEGVEWDTTKMVGILLGTHFRGIYLIPGYIIFSLVTANNGWKKRERFGQTFQNHRGIFSGM